MSRKSTTACLTDRAADSESFLTIVEVSVELRCSSKTIRRQIRGGKLRAVKFGGRYLVRARDLADFLGAAPALATVTPTSQGPS
jgi:excisionase family DNA binding protein